MCGIAGIIGPDGSRAIEPMIRALVHRGPDGEGRFCDALATLGQTRLSIIDIEGGRQPIANETGAIQLVCNGEIYNSPELRDRLEADGHVFRTRTDVEVILHLYEERGDACVRELRGMFAFALWDAPRRRLLLARDPLGQKPLFFVEADGRLVFASEIRALLASGLVEPRPDLNGLWHYVSLRFLPDEYTLFRGVRSLPAASTLVWEDGRLTLDRYWELQFRPKLAGDEREITDALEACLLEAVRAHLLSDVRVGAYVSGGIDSSTIAAMMATVSGETVPSFSIGVREQSFDELPYARLVSRRYGMEAHERVVRADLVYLVPSMIHHLDEPADPFGVGVYLAAGLASERVKVVLSGDGGDENFAGYDRFAGQRLAEIYGALPLWLRRQVLGRLVRRLPESFGYKSFAQKVSWLHAMSFHSAGERYAQSMSFLRFTPEAKRELFTPSARASLEDPDSVAKILRHFDAGNADDLVDRMLYTDLMTRIPGNVLSIVDRMSMAHSVETRPPLMDVRVVEFAASIPADLKLRGRRLKHILRSVASRYLPRELVDRPKQGFGFPLGPWMRNELAGFLRRLFAESRFVEEGIFEPACLDRLCEEHIGGLADHSYRLWVLLNLELWYRLYFEGETVDGMRAFTDRLMAS
ncbi:MAG: asparagine synthase (glutamine-hydrolyzing) [Gemmatimonadota bacterium]